MSAYYLQHYNQNEGQTENFEKSISTGVKTQLNFYQRPLRTHINVSIIKMGRQITKERKAVDIIYNERSDALR